MHGSLRVKCKGEDDALPIMVIDEIQVKLLAWYDKEWGYANRMLDLVEKIAHLIHAENSRAVYGYD